MSWRYEFYFLVLKQHFTLPLENEIHIFAPPYNILYFLASSCHATGWEKTYPTPLMFVQFITYFAKIGQN